MLPAPQALRLIMHLGEPLPESRPDWQFNLPALLAFFLLTFAIMCWTNGVGASTGGCSAGSQGSQPHQTTPNAGAGLGIWAAAVQGSPGSHCNQQRPRVWPGHAPELPGGLSCMVE